MFDEGTEAPDFTLPDAEGTEHSLSDHRGSWVVVAFYPADDTPGCTKQACSVPVSYTHLTLPTIYSV